MPHRPSKQVVGRIRKKFDDLNASMERAELKYFHDAGHQKHTSISQSLRLLGKNATRDRQRLELELGISAVRLWEEMLRHPKLEPHVGKLQDARYEAMQRRYGKPEERSEEFADCFDLTYQNEMGLMLLMLVDRNVNPAKWRRHADTLFSNRKQAHTRSTIENTRDFLVNDLGLDYKRIRLKRRKTPAP